jgi:hypothetical protein
MAKRTAEQYEALIQKHMKTLKCTRDEAIDIIACDDEIDGGNKELFALTDEQKKLVRKITKADKKPDTAKKPTKRERKVNENKKILIEKIAEALADTENLSVKTETEISFTYNGKAYSVKLTEHREKKSEK